ncbi:MAG TPA: ABC transporter permease [Gemmatimonadales bacterium]
MSLWRQLRSGLRRLTHRHDADRELAEEVGHYLEQAAAAHEATGLSPEAALRAARMELGSVTAVEDQIRAYGWENLVETLLADLRYAARRLRTAPAFAAITVLTLALGIGATTAIFSAVNPILFEPLPYPAPGRIMTIWDIGPEGEPADVTFGTLRELEARTRSFQKLAVLKPWQPTLQGAAEPERIEGQRVGAGYFRVLGVPPAFGQDFDPADDRPGGRKVVILSDGLWQRRFAGDRAIIGQAITLDGDDYLVVGVMPKDFENVLSPSAELWTPLQYDMSLGSAWGHHLRMVGRLRPGTGADAARRELDRIAAEPAAEFPRAAWAALDNGLVVRSLQDDLTRGVRPALLAVFTAASVVLLLAAVNVTNLLLARGVQRRGEFALRAALGAAGHRLLRQMLTESLLLAAVGGAAGIVVALVGVRILVALSPAGLPRAGAIGVDGTVFAFGLAITTLVGLALGLTPALQASRQSPGLGLQQSSSRAGGAPARVQGVLVVAEVALALVLLVSSGLLFRSLERLFAVTAGFEPSGLLTMQLQTSGHRYNADSTTHRFFVQALEAVRAVPGVTQAALTSQLPLSGDVDLYGLHFDPRPAIDPGEIRGTFRYAVSPGYIEAMGVPLRSGRSLSERDRAGAPPVALISESVARRRLPGLDPIGRQLRVGDGAAYTVVGVVGDVRQVSLALSESEAVYVSAAQWRFADPAMSLVVRARGEVAALAPAIRRAIWSVDRDQAIVRVATMDELLTASAAERRFALILFEGFAITALVLAAAGIYGVLAGRVAERTREIGVRSALGASRSAIVGLVVRQGLALAGFGIAIGIAGAAVATQLMTAMLFGVSRLDPGTYLVVSLTLTAVALTACAVPAWRAARVDPVMTLRTE